MQRPSASAARAVNGDLVVHADLVLVELVAILLGGVALLLFALVSGVRRQRRRRQEEMRRGNEIYRDWLRTDSDPPEQR